MKLKKFAQELENVDDLISQLYGQSSSVSSSSPTQETRQDALDESGLYQLPVRNGKAGRSFNDGEKPWVVGNFYPGQYLNENHKEGHNGVDLKSTKGTPIYPIAPGIVILTANTPKGGLNCKVSHEGGAVVSYYAHMDSLNVSNGDYVGFNTILGSMGDTGNAKGTGDHLHYEVKVNGSLVDPFSMTGKQVGSFSKAQEVKAELAFYNILDKYSKINKKDSLYKMATEINKQINLSPKEKEIFDILISVVNDKSPTTTLRVAGGWVRDKLLGKESHDIDVACDDISGLEFAKLTHEWLQEHGLSSGKSVAQIDANTEKNKNIESASLPILGMSIDFVQLRADTYNEDSRNPEIQTGVSAEEDAKRRDLTINSIFYNINKGEIEDYVGGVDDLNNRIARTPLEPLKTYTEDPLRILRAIRFAAKYDLELDPSLILAAKDPKVQYAFKNKISKERIWTELVGQKEADGWKKGLIIGPNFHRAVRLMADLGLRDLILTPNEDQITRALSKQKQPDAKEGLPDKSKKWEKGFSTWDLNQNNPHHDKDVWEHTLSALEYLHKLHQNNVSEGKVKSEEDQIVRNLAMLFHDIGKCDECSRQETESGTNTYHEHELSSAVMAEEILTDLKAPTDIKNRIVSLVKNHMRLHTMPSGANGVGLRRIVRDVGGDWGNLVEMSKSDSMGKGSAKELDPKYDQFAAVIDQFLTKNQGSSEVKSPISGKEIMETLGIKAGKQVGEIVKALKEKLLEDPDMDKEEAIAFIKTI